MAGSTLADANDAFGIYGGLRRGGVSGDASAAINASKLASGSGLLSGQTGSQLNSAAGYASNVLGIYSGLKQGGVVGDSTAAVNAAQLGARAGAFGSASSAIGQYAGYAAVPLSVYNFVNNYQSGKTGSDTLQGAEAGAAIGSVIPVVGTAVGTVVGAAVGALSSAFGPGAKDPETNVSQSVINATSSNANNPAVAASVQNPYLALAGLMDERSSTLPEYAQYGRMGEQKFTNDMVTKINQAAQQGIISQSSTPQEVYNKVVAPWVAGMGSGYSNVGAAYTATNQGLLQDMVSQYMSGQASQDWKAVGGDQPFANLPKYGSLGFGSSSSAMPTQSNTTQARPGVSTASAVPGVGSSVLGQPSSSSFLVPAAAGLTGMAANTMTAGGPGGDPTGMANPATQVQVNPNNLGATPTGTGSGGSADLSGLAGLLSSAGLSSGLSSGIAGAAPYLLSGGIGLYQASQTSAQDKAAVQNYSNLGAPYTQAGTQLLSQAQSGQLNPAQQNVVSTLNAQGQTLINSASPLSDIANTAFANYQAGNLNPGQQQQIDAWTASAKEQLRQTLASSGISDSSVLASQDAAIDSQATQLKSNLMAQNLQVGDQQYSQWLTSTQAGQQLISQGAQYAATSLDTMLSQALQLGSLGSSIQGDAIKLGLQQDQILSNNVSNLMKSITSAYAVANKPANTSTTGGGGGNGLGGIAGGVASGASNPAAARLAGFANQGAAGQNAITSNTDNLPGGNPGAIQPLTQDQLQVPDINSTISGMNTSFGGDGSYSMNPDNTVDTSTFNNFFYDPSTTDLSSIDFGGG